MGLTTWYDKVILASPDTWIKSADLTRYLNTRDLLTQTLRILSSSLQQSTPPGRNDRPVEGARDLDSHGSVPLSQLRDQGPITYSFSVSSVEKWKWTPNLLPIWHILKGFHKQKTMPTLPILFWFTKVLAKEDHLTYTYSKSHPLPHCLILPLPCWHMHSLPFKDTFPFAI